MSDNRLLIYAGAALGLPGRRSKMLLLKQISSFMRFCQDNGLTRRELLKVGQSATIYSKVVRADLTDEGYELYKAAYRSWSSKVDSGRIDPDNTEILVRSLTKMREATHRLGPANQGRPSSASNKTRRRKSQHGLESEIMIKSSHISPSSSSIERLDKEYEEAGPYVYDKSDWHLEEKFPLDRV